jgi:hypothetical protein
MTIFGGSSEGTVAVLTRLLEEEKARYADLLEKYHALKLQGAATPPPMVQGLAKRADDPIMDAISLAAGTDQERRRYLGNWVKQERMKGREQEAIVHDLLNWQVVGEGDEA